MRKRKITWFPFLILLMAQGNWGYAQSVLQSIEQEKAALIEQIQKHVVSISTLKQSPGKPAVKTNFSGVILDKEGHVLTIGAAIRDAVRVQVTLYNGTQFSAKTQGLDSLTDIGVIQIENPKDLDPIEWGDSDQLQKGHFLFTVGNPFDLHHSVSTGIVSGTSRLISQKLPYMIQMTANINPGDPGGLVANSSGKFVGMMYSTLGSSNSKQMEFRVHQLENRLEDHYSKLLKLLNELEGKALKEALQKEISALEAQKKELALPSPFTGSQGINFFLPSNRIQFIANEIIKHGNVQRGKLGVMVEPLSEAEKKQHDLDHGVIVREVNAGGPAADAGLLVNDILISCKGIPIQDPIQVRDLIQENKPGTKVEMQVFRENKRQSIWVTLGK